MKNIKCVEVDFKKVIKKEIKKSNSRVLLYI